MLSRALPRGLRLHATTMRFAICNELFEGWEFGRVCRFLGEIGYDGLEVAPFTLGPSIGDLTPGQLTAWRDQARDAGLDVIGLHWLLAKTEGMHLTSSDAAARHRLGRYLVELARLCRGLGGALLVFGSPKQRSLMPGVSHEQAVARAADTFRAVLPEIADLDVTICMEPLSTAETDFVTTCAQGAHLVEAVGHPNFVLHLDVKAMSNEPVPVPDLIRQYAPSAGHFHANDANLRGPGFGETDFVPIFQALREATYDRWVSVEVFNFTPDPETVATRSLEYMRACLGRAG
jgi:sugar phosphate isomerase/epimerase